MFELCGLGELLIDFTPAGFSPAGNLLFERNRAEALPMSQPPPQSLACGQHLWVRSVEINSGFF